jgi:hypothetical protein
MADAILFLLFYLVFDEIVIILQLQSVYSSAETAEQKEFISLIDAGIIKDDLLLAGRTLHGG